VRTLYWSVRLRFIRCSFIHRYLIFARHVTHHFIYEIWALVCNPDTVYGFINPSIRVSAISDTTPLVWAVSRLNIWLIGLVSWVYTNARFLSSETVLRYPLKPYRTWCSEYPWVSWVVEFLGVLTFLIDNAGIFLYMLAFPFSYLVKNSCGEFFYTFLLCFYGRQWLRHDSRLLFHFFRMYPV